MLLPLRGRSWLPLPMLLPLRGRSWVADAAADVYVYVLFVLSRLAAHAANGIDSKL
jgi:hypothetical protein